MDGTIFDIVQQPHQLDAYDDETQIVLAELAIDYIDEHLERDRRGRGLLKPNGIAVMQRRRDGFVQWVQMARERIASRERKASKAEGSDELAIGSQNDSAEAQIAAGGHTIEVQVDIVDAKNGTRRKFRREFLSPANMTKIEIHAGLRNAIKVQENIVREEGTLLWGIDFNSFGEYFTPEVEDDGEESEGVQHDNEEPPASQGEVAKGKEITRECVSCLDLYTTKDLEELQCGHEYCAPCLSDVF